MAGNTSSGARASTQLSSAANAMALDPDIHPWERQPEESTEAYAQFLIYRDMPEKRILADFDRNPDYVAKGYTSRRGRELSSRWSWGYRCYKFDRFMGQQDLEELVRYRREMGERQRTIGRAGLAKMAKWVDDLNVGDLTPAEAARLLETFAKLEREAAGAYTIPGNPDEIPTGDNAPAAPKTLGDLIPGIDPTVESDLARALADLLP